MTPSFATTDDVAALMQRDLSAVEVTAAELLLADASDVIRRYVRQTVTAVANDVVILRGNFTARLELPERPVTAVTAVTIGSTPLTPLVDYCVTGAGVLLRGPALPAGTTEDLARGGSWGGPDADVTVTYSHGYTNPPGTFRSVCLDLLERRLVRPIGVVREQIGGYVVQYDRTEPSGVVLLPGDEARLRPWRRNPESTR